MVFIEDTENTKHGFGLENNAQLEIEPVLLHEQKANQKEIGVD
jgi:hypothetical protein